MEEDDTWKIYGYGGLKMRIMIMHDAPHVSHAMDEEWARTYFVLWCFFITGWWCQIHTDTAMLCLNVCLFVFFFRETLSV